jgi:uncharacterized protein (DUF4415 family)
MKKPLKIPVFKTDKQAERFVATADLSQYDLRGRPMSEVFPQLVSQMKRRGRPPLGDQNKTRITIRLDADIVAAYRDGGPGWQTKINADLRKATGLK